MDIRPASSYIPFRARTARIAKDENLSADAAAVRAATPPAPADERDGNPRIKLLSQLRNPEDFDQLQPPDRAKPTYDLAAYAARRCVQAYLPVDRIEDEVAADGGAAFKSFQRFSDAAFGYRRDSTVVIAFRGTEGGLNGLRQWPLTNLRAFAVRSPRRHLGFQMAWERLRPDMVEWIERTLPKGGQLILTGHSLGGAIAILAAFELAEDYHVRAVVTIGAPRVGLAEFRDQYLTKPNRPVVAGEPAAVLGEVTRRITHADDFVSRVPPGPIYRHVGEESRLDAQGMLVPGESRSAFDRLFAGLDAAVGWCYRQMDAQRMTSLPVAAPSYGATVLGRPPVRIPGVGVVETPTRPLGRLGRDMLRMQQRFPFLSMVTLTGIQWTLIGAGAAISCGVFLISLIDLNSHRSKLYVDAFVRRYAVTPIALNNPAISEFVRRALEPRREE